MCRGTAARSIPKYGAPPRRPASSSISRVSAYPLCSPMGNDSSTKCRLGVGRRPSRQIPRYSLGQTLSRGCREFEVARRDGTHGKVDDQREILIAWNPHGDRVGPEQRPGSACRGKARAGNGHRDGDHVPLQCHKAVCSGRSEMAGTASGHRGRPTCPRLVDTDRQGVPSNQLAECSVAVDACPGGAVCSSAYRWGGIGQSRLQLPDIATQSHAAVAVNASKIRLDEGTGDEFRVLPRHAAVGEDLRAQLRQPEVMDMHRSSSGVGTGDNRPQYTRGTGGCPTNRERIPSF